jgi:hypothetical protein
MEIGTTFSNRIETGVLERIAAKEATRRIKTATGIAMAPADKTEGARMVVAERATTDKPGPEERPSL